MLASRGKRLAELERSLAATHEQLMEKCQEALWEQFSDAELEAVVASAKRREQPGYVPVAEDKAIEQRWLEAVGAIVPADRRVLYEWRAWAVAWGKAIRERA